MSTTLKIACTILLSLSCVSARWIEPNEAPIEINSYKREVIVHKDGTSETIEEREITILNENGKNAHGTHTESYTEDMEAVTVLEAKTIKDGKEYPVPKENIEDKEIASSDYGYKKEKQILIAFPQVQVGSKLYYKIKTDVKKTNFPDTFITYGNFGSEGYWKQGSVKITSEVPLKKIISDPQNVLTQKESQKDNKHILEISLAKPYVRMFNIMGGMLLTSKDFFQGTNFIVSNKDMLDALNNQYADYEKKTTTPLPKIFQKMVDKAKKVSDPAEQINTVLTDITKKLRYMGDWRATNAGFVPRSITEIAQTRYGDCKDHSLVLRAILQELGFQAYIVIVHRGPNYLPPKGDVWKYQLNHAIVKAVDKNGRNYWLDATNPVAMATGIFPDIADRPVMVIKKDKILVDHIPAIDPTTTTLNVNKKVTLKEEEIIAQGDIKLSGDWALHVYETWCSSKNVKDIEKMLEMRTLGMDAQDTKIDFTPPQSCTVQPVAAHFRGIQKGQTLKTNMGIGIPLNNANFLSGITFKDMDDLEHTYLGFPTIIQSSQTIENMHINNPQDLNVDIKTPWINLSRIVKQEGNNVTIQQKFEFLKSYITIDDKKDPQFIKLREDINKCFKNIGVILKPAEPTK